MRILLGITAVTLAAVSIARARPGKDEAADSATHKDFSDAAPPPWLWPMTLAGPAFVVGLVFVIVGLVRLLLGPAVVEKEPSPAHARWRLWRSMAVTPIVLLMIGFTLVAVIAPYGQLTIETENSDVKVEIRAQSS